MTTENQDTPVSEEEDVIVKEENEYVDQLWFKPKTVMAVNDKEKVNLISKYWRITWPLRNGPMTAKEIHDEFKLDEKGKDGKPKYEYTLKTIYRHLDKLEKADLIKQAGMRVRDDSRQSEKLYSRTARVFFVDFAVGDSEESEKIRNMEKIQKIANEMLSILYDVPKPDDEKFIEIAKKIEKQQDEFRRFLFRETAENPKLEELFGQYKIETLNKVIELATTITLYISEKPDFVKQLEELYTS